jgi:hypothetical protein
MIPRTLKQAFFFLLKTHYVFTPLTQQLRKEILLVKRIVDALFHLQNRIVINIAVKPAQKHLQILFQFSKNRNPLFKKLLGLKTPVGNLVFVTPLIRSGNTCIMRNNVPPITLFSRTV